MVLIKVFEASLLREGGTALWAVEGVIALRRRKDHGFLDPLKSPPAANRRRVLLFALAQKTTGFAGGFDFEIEMVSSCLAGIAIVAVGSAAILAAAASRRETLGLPP